MTFNRAQRAAAVRQSTSKIAFAGLFSLCVVLATDANAQRSERSFTATGRECSDITWQPEVLAQYPNIDDACQEVVQYGDRYFVRFTGTVQSVSRGGATMTVQFDGADESVTLSPPENLRIVIGGRQTRLRDLARGQELTFHVPADQFVANFFEPGAQPPAQLVAVTIVPLTVAQQGASTSSGGRTLPQTAGFLPALALFGALSIAAGGVGLGVFGTTTRKRPN